VDIIRHFPSVCNAVDGAVIYARVSTYDQARYDQSRGWLAIMEQTDDVIEAMQATAPHCRILGTAGGIEVGQIIGPRFRLDDAVGMARAHGCPILAWDASRFLRANSYCRQTNPEAKPTPNEWALLAKKTEGIMLATIIDPCLPENGKDGRHAQAIKRSRKVRQRRTISDELAQRISDELGPAHRISERRLIFRKNTIRDVAKQFGVSVSAIKRLLDRQSPQHGCTWRERALDLASEDYMRRWRDYDEARKKVALPGYGVLDWNPVYGDYEPPAPYQPHYQTRTMREERERQAQQPAREQEQIDAIANKYGLTVAQVEEEKRRYVEDRRLVKPSFAVWLERELEQEAPPP
jgi:transposase